MYPYELALGSVNLSVFGGFMAGMVVGDGTVYLTYSETFYGDTESSSNSVTLQASECADDAEDCMEMHTNFDYGLLFCVGYPIMIICLLVLATIWDLLRL